MKKRRNLSESQLYESIYSPPETPQEEKKQEIFKIDFVKKEEKKLKKELNGYQGRTFRSLSFLWTNFFAHFGEEWIYLMLLGVFIAVISYVIDKGAMLGNRARMWLFQDMMEYTWIRFYAWVTFPVCLCIFSAGVVRILAPTATGSGIPEIKTILRGVYIGNVLTFKTLVAKTVGIICTLGSGMPLGKEGPLIHISGCCAALLGKLVSFQQIYQHERKVELLAVASAVGVSCCFGAPVGGVLFSIEITTSYFAVRNFRRGFCAAIWGAAVYRLLLVWIEGEPTLTVLNKTTFMLETPFPVQELLAFAILGIIGGLGGSFYMLMCISYQRFLASNKTINAVRKDHFFVYPGFIALVVSSMLYPMGMGKFVASHVPYLAQLTQLFSNFSWTSPNLTIAQQEIADNFRTPYTEFYLHLLCIFGFHFVFSILAVTMPIPNGSFLPTLVMGAAMGRIIGELMYTWYPAGVSHYGEFCRIIPGGYAVVGAAAFSSAVTQRISLSILMLEMTGQITYGFPVLLAVVIANGIARTLVPSVYDSGIKARKLPFLPDILPNNTAIHNIYVEDFMARELKHVYNGITYEKLRRLLMDNRKVHSFPLVNNPERMVLLGSIQRVQLVALIEKHIGRKRRLREMTEFEERLCFKNRRPKYRTQMSVGVLEEQSTSYLEYENLREILPKYRKIRLPRERICDLPPDLQRRWEDEQVKMPTDFSSCQIDPSPFHLVEKTSLVKAHTLFSLLGVNTAYVISTGKLMGVVEVADLGRAIDDVNGGRLQPRRLQIVAGGGDDVEKS